MKKLIFVVLFCGLLYATTLSAGAERLSEEVKLKKTVSPTGVTIGSKISVAVTTDSEEDPAVAFCNGVYLVVYMKNDDIYGQRLDDEGTLLGDAFKINSDFEPDNPTSQPDVACIWPAPLFSTKYFVVVWTYHDDSDNDVHAQALYTDGTPTGTQLLASFSGNNEQNPSIACEVDDYYCLVIYEFDNGEIEGQRLQLIEEFLNNHIDTYGDKFDPGSESGSAEANPDVTWSMDQEEYMAVWQSWYAGGTADAHDRVKMVFIYEDEQGTSLLETIGSPAYLIPHGTFGTGWEHQQEHPEVAYNNISDNYMVTYREINGTNQNGVGVIHNGSAMVGSPFRLDTNSNSVLQTEVAYSGGQTGASNAENEFLAVDIELRPPFLDYHDIVGAYINGNTISAREHLIDAVTSSIVMVNPDITGNPVNGTYLVVWEEQHSLPVSNSNIFAMRVGNRPPTKVFLPLVIR